MAFKEVTIELTVTKGPFSGKLVVKGLAHGELLDKLIEGGCDIVNARVVTSNEPASLPLREWIGNKTDTILRDWPDIEPAPKPAEYPDPVDPVR